MSKDLGLRGAIWLTLGGETFGGAGQIALLAKLAECGSITRAAKVVGMSYKAAWDIIDGMNNLAGEPLVERLAGGRGGGGSRLTERGQRLVENFHMIEAAHRRFVAQLDEQDEGMTDDYLLIRRMAMRTSARNQFLGKITRVTSGAVNDEVELALPGGHLIVATVTHESTQGLHLQPGHEAFALVKASSIIVVVDEGGARFSTRNRLTGTISRVVPGAVNTEVCIDLPGGCSVLAIVTQVSGNALGLAVGQTASAIFKASSVILGVAD